MEEVIRKPSPSPWSPTPVAVAAAMLVAAGWTAVLTTVQVNPGRSPPEYGWPLVCRVADAWTMEGGILIVEHTRFLPGPLIVDALCALATVATTFVFVQLVAVAAFGPRPFTTASTMMLVAVAAALLAAGRLIPDQAGTLALWPFLFGLASPLLLLGLGYARALARNSKT